MNLRLSLTSNKSICPAIVLKFNTYFLRFLLLFATLNNDLYATSSGNIFLNSASSVQQSIQFKRVFDNKVLFEDHADRLLIPASVSKLLTAAAVLDKYGPHSTFKTIFYHTGSLQKGIIQGDLIIVGVGDPMMINEKLWQMAADFRHMGITGISGNLIIDNSLFEGPSRDPSRKAGLRSSSNAYDAPVTAFGVNFNTFPVVVSPGEKIGDLGRIGIDPYPIDGIVTNNKIKTVLNGRSQIKVSRSSHEDQTHIHVQGVVSQQDSLKKFYRSVGKPILMAGESIRAFLKHEGIHLAGKVKEDRLPQHATEFYSIESYPVSQMIHGLNKYSNNFIADVLTQKLGADFYRPVASSQIVPGSIESGSQVLSEFMHNKVGVKSNFSLFNGSGLDERNRLNASQMVDLLVYMAKRMDLFPEFLHSLPAAGSDGSLRDRFHRPNLSELKGIIRAKTGTLTSPVTVASLAGYLQHPQHGLIAFAIIENGIPKKSQPSILDLRDHHEQALLKLWKTW